MNKLSKEKRDQLILTLLMSLMIIVGLWYGVISFLSDKLEATKKELEEAKAKVQKAERLLGKAVAIRDDLDNAQSELEERSKKMASGDLYSWIITTLSQISAAHQVDIPEFSGYNRQEVEMLPEFPYEAAIYTVRGNAYYHDFGQFLETFENSFPYARVQNLSMQPMNREDGATTERLSFQVDVVALIKDSNGD